MTGLWKDTNGIVINQKKMIPLNHIIKESSIHFQFFVVDCHFSTYGYVFVMREPQTSDRISRSFCYRYLYLGL
jgi:hypothetical protein